jgi:hypothetical protein
MNIIGKYRIKEVVALHQDRLTGTDAFLVDASPNSANGFEMTKLYTIKTLPKSNQEFNSKHKLRIISELLL